jgi:hypothetical protein
MVSKPCTFYVPQLLTQIIKSIKRGVHQQEGIPLYPVDIMIVSTGRAEDFENRHRTATPYFLVSLNFRDSPAVKLTIRDGSVVFGAPHFFNAPR